MLSYPTTPVHIEPIVRITKDIREATRVMSAAEARYLVDTYYQVQDFRKASANQIRSMSESEEPNTFLQWTADTMEHIENQIKSGLNRYTDQHTIGIWAKSITGIGPVLSAGLMAHIDIERAPTVGHIWRFAGQDPTVVWGKGEKRPWNADLKVLCWKIGESFVKVSNNDKDIYGKVYATRKLQEQERNELGLFKDQAERKLETTRIGKDTEAFKWYSQGMLPPAHIQSRAKRYAVKLFLAHWHHVAYEDHYGTQPPKPYVIEHGGHVHYIAPPNWPMQ